MLVLYFPLLLINMSGLLSTDCLWILLILLVGGICIKLMDSAKEGMLNKYLKIQTSRNIFFEELRQEAIQCMRL